MIPRRGQSSHSQVYRGLRVPMWTRRNKLETGVNGNKKGRRIQSCTCLTSASSVRRSWSHPSHRQIVTVSPSSSAPGDPGSDPDVSVLIPSSSSSMCVSSCMSNSCSSGGGLRDSDMVECHSLRWKKRVSNTTTSINQSKNRHVTLQGRGLAIALLEMSPPESHPSVQQATPWYPFPLLSPTPIRTIGKPHTTNPGPRGSRFPQNKVAREC